MATSTIPAFMDALCAQLRERDGLEDVAILSAPMGSDTPREAIVLFDADAGQEWGALGNRRKEETYTVRGGVWIVVPGAGDAAAAEARETAFGVFAELADQLWEDPRVAGTVRVAKVDGLQFEQGFNTEGRWAQVTFTIGVSASLPRE